MLVVVVVEMTHFYLDLIDQSLSVANPDVFAAMQGPGGVCAHPGGYLLYVSSHSHGVTKRYSPAWA